MAKDDGGTIGGRQPKQPHAPGIALDAALDDRFGGLPDRGSRLDDPAVGIVERQRHPSPAAAPRQPVATQVQDDGREPATEAELGDPRRVVLGHRAVGTDEGVLGCLLGVVWVAQHPQGDGVQPVLVVRHEGRKGAIQVPDEGRDEPRIGVVRRGSVRFDRVHHLREPSWPANRCITVRYPWRIGSAARRRATIEPMGHDDRFDDLIASLGGFHRTWLVYLGLELGLFAAIRAAGAAGVSPRDLASSTGTHLPAVETWAWAADAHELTVLEDGRLTMDADVAAMLLDGERADHLGGQFVHAVTASMDWGGMAAFFRTGQPITDRPDRYRAAIERLTRQDIAVFFQEVLAALPQLVADLSRGGRVVDVHCGGGRWLVAMARRFPELSLVGVEFEPDSVARARATIEAEGLADRIEIREGKATQPGSDASYDLAYFQYALHQLPDAEAVLRAAWAAIRPGGRILVLDWPLPSEPEEFRTRHGELIAGVQLDELYQGTALATRDQFLAWFEAAGLPAPSVIDLPSGATAFLAERTA